MHENVYTIAVLPAREGCLDGLLGMLESLAASTRQEHGCIEYGFYQDGADSNVVLSFERWVDQEAEDKHWQTAHLKQAIASMGELLESDPKIFKTKKII